MVWFANSHLFIVSRKYRQTENKPQMLKSLDYHHYNHFHIGQWICSTTTEINRMCIYNMATAQNLLKYDVVYRYSIFYDFNHCWSNVFWKRCYQRNDKPWRGHFLISYADRTLLYYDRFTHFLECIWFRRLTYHLTPFIVQCNVRYSRYLIPLSVHWMVSNVMARTWVSDDKFSQTCYKLHPVVSLSGCLSAVMPMCTSYFLPCIGGINIKLNVACCWQGSLNLFFTE